MDGEATPVTAETHVAPQHHVHAAGHRQHVTLAERIGALAGDRRFRLCITAFLIYTVITLVMFWYVTLGIASYVPNGQGDVYQSMWNLWWASFSVFSLHSSPYFTHLIFFPVGANLATQDLSPLAGILSAPFQAVSLAFAYNIIFLLGFILSGLFTFMLLLYLTKNSYASFLGGLVFAFSPMHTAQAIGHLNWASIEFVPLFLLFFILMVRETRLRYVVASAVSFLFVVFFGDPEQGIILIVFVVLLGAAYLLLRRRSALAMAMNKGFAVRFGAMVALILILGSPFLIPITESLLSSSTLATANQLSGPVNQLLWSDNLASYFLPSYYNGIFHTASLSYFHSVYGLIYNNVVYTPDVTEKVSYLGYSVLALALIALYFDFRRHKLRNTAVWLVLLLAFGWLSLGPELQVMGTLTGIPAVYAAYSHIPIFNIVREPGRFDLGVTLCLAVLSALGFAYLTEGKPRTQVLICAAVFFVLIMIEYGAMPLTQGYAASLTANATIPTAYSQLGKLNGNFSVLVLPALPDQNSTSPDLYPAISMYYATAMDGKPILGGYTSRENTSQEQSVEEMPVAAASLYLEEGEGLVYPSPVIGNVTNETLVWLANYNTQFIAVERSAYNLSEQATIYDYLTDTFGNALYVDNSTFVFGTSDTVLAKGGRALTAYPIGTWIPGYEFCGPGTCNNTLDTMWWGTNERGIVIYAPNAMRVVMNISAISALNQTPLYLYLNNTQVGVLNLTSVQRRFSAYIDVSPGFSQLVLYTPNETGAPSPYLLYGAKNITFARVT